MQNHKVAVLAVARVVPYGATIAAADLQVVEINDAAGLRPIGSGSKSVIVGKRAAVELRPGTLLTSDQVTETVAIKSGEMLVPIAVDSSRMPVRGLTPGTQIVIVTSPVPMGGNNAPTTTPGQIRATVIRSTGFRDSGPTILDVAVPPQDGPLLATRVMEGKFSVVVLNTGNADTPPGTGGAT
nr:SAF domain-containing protein [Streptomyces sp. SID3343]